MWNVQSLPNFFFLSDMLLVGLTIFHIFYCFYVKLFGGGWVSLYSFICLSAEAVERESSCFATTLLHHAPFLSCLEVDFI